jgi:hypothetical protein
MMVLNLGCVQQQPDRIYHIYNIVNGEFPNQEASAKVQNKGTGEKLELKGLVIYQRFEVQAESTSRYDADAKADAEVDVGPGL